MIWHPTTDARHTKEEAFCRDVDNMLMGRLQAHAESDEAKARLAKMPHLKDAKLVSLLSRLGITPEGLIAVQLVPMTLVAWASGSVDDKERKLIFDQAKRFGIRERSEPFALLDHWMSHRPSPLLMETWRRFISLELKSLSGKPREKLIELTKEEMLAVAKCSGGFLGLGRVSSTEHRLISTMSKVLDECSHPTNH